MTESDVHWPASEIATMLQHRRERGESVALAVGSFDILHPGHVDFLRRAAERADILVVGVLDDVSVRERGGRGRPLNPADERVELVAALRWVDRAFAFAQDQAGVMVETISPDVVCVDDSCSFAASVVAAGIAAGVRITTLPRLLDHSQEAIVSRVRAIPLKDEAAGPEDRETD